jgi:hypothetical protein
MAYPLGMSLIRTGHLRASRAAAAMFGLRVVSPDRAGAAVIAAAMRLESWRLRFLRAERVAYRRASRASANVLVYAFDAEAMNASGHDDDRVREIGADRAPVKIFLQLPPHPIHGVTLADIDGKNRRIESMARRCGAHLVIMSDLMRSGAARRLTRSGRPNALGYLSIAHVINRIVKTHLLREALPDSLAQTSHPPNADAVLDAIAWSEPSLPESLEAVYSREMIQAFADGVVFFPSFPGWGRYKLADPIDWGMEGANWSWQSYFTGLEFVRPALAYWRDAAHGRANERERIAEMLKERGLTPNDLFFRASKIIAEFARANPPTKPANQRAYLQGTICRRVKALLAFLVCCGTARRMGLSIDREDLELAIKIFSDSMEILKDEDAYPSGGNHGVRQDALFVAAGLVMPGDPYARSLLELGTDRLRRLQLRLALSKDGVWKENSFGYHCVVMNVLRMLASDLRRAGRQEAAMLHEALEKMETFVEALIRPDGYGPLLGDTAPRRYGFALEETKVELAAAGRTQAERAATSPATRRMDTYYFPDSGYFASHSSRALDENGSTAIFCATLSGRPKHKQSDDLSVIFARGSMDLLIDGGTFNKEISDTVRNCARYDPASHNSFRVNGAGYPLRAPKGARRAGLAGFWRGEGWAAARGFNRAYEDGGVERTIIHLKRHHALIVLDELTSKSQKPARFDQFWHFAPGLEAKDAGSSRHWVFSARGGLFLAGFDAEEAPCALGKGGPDEPIAWTMLMDGGGIAPTPYLRRTKELTAGRMASIFQWSNRSATIEIECAPATGGTSEIRARGADLECAFAVSAGGVRLLALRG